MKGLATNKLRSFSEAALGHEIRIFGNVAVAVAVCQMTENEMQVTRGIEMMLLVKTDGRWRIVSQRGIRKLSRSQSHPTFSFRIDRMMSAAGT